MHRTASLALCLAMTAGAALAAPQATLPVTAPQTATAVAAPTLDERLGCGVLFLSIGDLSRRFPQILSKVAPAERGSAAGLIRVLSVSGAQMYDRAAVDGAAQGRTPSQLYSIGLGHVMATFDGAKDRQTAGEQGKAMFMRCMAIAGE